MEQIQEAIADTLKVLSLTATASAPAIKDNRPLAPPFCYLITNISATTANTLLSKQFWTMPSLIFFAIPFKPPISRFVCALNNLTYAENHQKTVQLMVKEAILDNPNARAHIEALDPLNKLTFYNIVNSLDAVALPMFVKGGERKKIVWNLYIDPHFESPDLHYE
jgi:hypothetical protein